MDRLKPKVAAPATQPAPQSSVPAPGAAGPPKPPAPPKPKAQAAAKVPGVNAKQDGDTSAETFGNTPQAPKMGRPMKEPKQALQKALSDQQKHKIMTEVNQHLGQKNLASNDPALQATGKEQQAKYGKPGDSGPPMKTAITQVKKPAASRAVTAVTKPDNPRVAAARESHFVDPAATSGQKTSVTSASNSPGSAITLTNNTVTAGSKSANKSKMAPVPQKDRHKDISRINTEMGYKNLKSPDESVRAIGKQILSQTPLKEKVRYKGNQILGALRGAIAKNEEFLTDLNKAEKSKEWKPGIVDTPSHAEALAQLDAEEPIQNNKQSSSKRSKIMIARHAKSKEKKNAAEYNLKKNEEFVTDLTKNDPDKFSEFALKPHPNANKMQSVDHAEAADVHREAASLHQAAAANPSNKKRKEHHENMRNLHLHHANKHWQNVNGKDPDTKKLFGKREEFLLEILEKAARGSGTGNPRAKTSRNINLSITPQHHGGATGYGGPSGHGGAGETNHAAPNASKAPSATPAKATPNKAPVSKKKKKDPYEPKVKVTRPYSDPGKFSLGRFALNILGHGSPVANQVLNAAKNSVKKSNLENEFENMSKAEISQHIQMLKRIDLNEIDAVSLVKILRKD